MNPSRSGTVVICVLTCLIVVSAIVTTTMQAALRLRREAVDERQLAQTELLCEAGILRASRQIRLSADYPGEQWRPKLELDSYSAAEVDIRILPSTDSSDRDVEVTARLSVANSEREPMQRSYRYTISNYSSSTSNAQSEE